MYEAAEMLAAENGIGGAEPFLKNRMRPAVESGALVLLDPIDGGPVTGRLCRPYDDWVTPKAINEWLAGAGFAYRWPVAATATQAPPVVAASDGPAPLTTGDIAHCFAGLRWDESGWKKPLGDKPKWLAGCVVIPGQKGVSERRWNPVFIGAALVQQGHVKARNVRAKFQTVDLLKPWLDVWKTYEADNFDSE